MGEPEFASLILSKFFRHSKNTYRINPTPSCPVACIGRPSLSFHNDNRIEPQRARRTQRTTTAYFWGTATPSLDVLGSLGALGVLCGERGASSPCGPSA